MTTDDHTSGTQWRFDSGQSVRLRGLDRSELNGTAGKVLFLDEAKMRYAVRLAKGEPTLLKAENLERTSNQAGGNASSARRAATGSDGGSRARSDACFASRLG